jgi:murein tripeptide amidase MpaA
VTGHRRLVDDDFPGGAIRVVRARARGAIELALRGDTAADVRQWFCFRIASSASRDLAIVDAADATFDGAWHRYRVMTSPDGRRWRRAATDLDGSALVVRHQGRAEPTWYAYFAPYGERRLARVLRAVAAADHVTVRPIGETVRGRLLPVVDLGDEDAERVVWIVARQHPGETPASWAAEGLLARLADAGDPAVRELLGRARVVVAPLVNLDGAHLGNHRTNAAGVDLNRSWDGPDRDAAPEVAALVDAIGATGVDLFLDLHADESSPFAFPAGCEGNPGWTEEAAAREAALRADLADRSADFVDRSWYGDDPPGGADLSAAANAIADGTGATALTLELPIGDRGEGHIRDGWSPARAAALGAELVDVLARAVRQRGSK